jgi:Tol biopolymer transport system component/DNA-binding winged helix-turn-helix (wHTH) protein
MSVTEKIAERVGFGLFEADLGTGELWKAGHRVKLQSQPFKVLAALLEKPGAVVTREELQTRLWGKDAVGDFDQSLGTAVNKIRDALGDTADNPRFVETLARRGYRFIAPVSVLASHAGAGVITPVSPVEVASGSERPPTPIPIASPESHAMPMATPPIKVADRAGRTGWDAREWLLVGFGSGLTLALGMAVWFPMHLGLKPVAPLRRIDQLTHTGQMAPDMPAMESLPASVTDGPRIFVPVLRDGRSVLSQVDVHTGAVQSLAVPREIASPMLGDLSPDGATLLLRSHLTPESEQPLWQVPASGGSALRVANVVGHDATWMPDGKSILYATGDQLIVNRLSDGSSTAFATVPGRAFWLRWSPDGKLLRFTLMDPIAHTLGLWEVGSDGKGLRMILQGWDQPSSECCGVWADNGRSFVFQSNRGGRSDLWRLEGKNVSGPVRLTDGPLSFAAPVAASSGGRIYFLGLENQSVLQVYDAARKQFEPEEGFLAGANRIEYTRDKAWVAWTDAAGRLWKARADGSEMLQVTPDSLQVFLAHWSPDGQRLALMAREAGKAWQLYTVSADGGSPEHVLNESRNAADPSWSADGQQIVFGRVSDVMGKEEGVRALEVLDLRTHTVTTVPGSEGMFSPRWSPDGRYIAAISLDQRRLLLFDTTTKTWHTLAETTAADPVWSASGKAIYFHAALAEMQPLYRVSIPDGRLEQVANLTSFAGGATADYFFCGLTAKDVPLVRTRTGTGNLYSLDLNER